MQNKMLLRSKNTEPLLNLNRLMIRIYIYKEEVYGKY